MKLGELPTWAMELAVAVSGHTEISGGLTVSIDYNLIEEDPGSEDSYWVLSLHSPVKDIHGHRVTTFFEHVFASRLVKVFENPAEVDIDTFGFGSSGHMALSFSGTFQGRYVVVDVHFHDRPGEEDAQVIPINRPPRRIH